MDNSYLQHYGIKGQKWGVRRFQDKNGRLTSAGKKRKEERETYRFKTSKGEELVMERQKTPFITKQLAKRNASIRREVENTYAYDVKANGKVVGNWQGYRKSPDEMNITWMDVSKKHQGKGYATAVMKQGEEIAKRCGAKKITAEVVGNSPDMLHVSEKLGYTQKGEIRTREVMEMWGGLTLIEKNI